jgi:glucose/arabinose dehydrogenase
VGLPGHWAPDDLKIYTGKSFPAAYQGGAFIAFHGSWNRAPAPQDGFNVVFQPLRNGAASGQWVVFADGFAGPDKARGRAAHRPTGLAIGPDGALFVSDDSKGRIWKITYHGPPNAPVAAAKAAD